MKIGNKTITNEGNDVLVIAEMAMANEGKIDLTKKIIKAAADVNADAIKFQKFTADELAVPSYKYYKLYKESEMTKDEWKEAVDYAKSLGLLVFADVFGKESAELMHSLNIDGFKMHSSEIVNPFLLKQVASYNKPILLSTGGTKLEEIDNAIETVKKSGNDKIILMHGFQNTPTKLEDSKLRYIETFRKRYSDLIIGFADHVDPESEFSLSLPLIAIGLGARVIEKHITLDRSLKGEDYESSLNPDEFKKMVRFIRDTEKALGKSEIKLSEPELRYRKLMKKYVVANRDIKKDETIDESNIDFKRAETDKELINIKDLLGKKVKVDMEKNHIIQKEEVGL